MIYIYIIYIYNIISTENLRIIWVIFGEIIPENAGPQDSGSVSDIFFNGYPDFNIFHDLKYC